jgi:hypothetical protein
LSTSIQVPDRSETPIDFELVRWSSLRAQLLSSSGQAPLAGVEVTYHLDQDAAAPVGSGALRHATSNEDGRFAIERLLGLPGQLTFTRGEEVLFVARSRFPTPKGPVAGPRRSIEVDLRSGEDRDLGSVELTSR